MDSYVDKPCQARPFQRLLKRAVDVACSALGMVLLSPFFFIIYCVLKRQGDGPVLFHQERVGRHGRPFLIHKFRTMRTDAEALGPRLAAAGDSRLTPVGRVLRRHHLDELPQLWNVFVGDMSMVGPRPERRFYIDKIVAAGGDYAPVLSVRPGVTSEATLSNGYTDTLEKMLVRLEMDRRYVEAYSLRRDFAIMFRTCFLVFFGEKKKGR